MTRPNSTLAASEQPSDCTQRQRRQALGRLLIGSASLPSLAEVPLRVLALLAHEDVSLADISTTLERDPVLAARLLRLANSPLFSRGRRLDSLRQAVVRLGFGELRTAVTTLGFVDALGMKSRIFDMRELFREAICCASICRKLAASERMPDCSSAFLAGLLHSIGHIVLGLCFSERFEACVLRARRSLLPMGEVIEAEFGFSPGEIGAHLLERWRMPFAVIDAVQYQSRPEKSPIPLSLAEIVGAAYRTTRSLGIGIEWPGDSTCDWEKQAIESLARRNPRSNPHHQIELYREGAGELEASLALLLPNSPRSQTSLLS